MNLARWTLVFTLTLGAPVSVCAQTAAAKPDDACIGKANQQKLSGYVLLLRLRYDIYAKWKETGVWPEDDKEANKALEGHSAYWANRLKEGRAVLAGTMNGDYWDNAALIVFEASSLEDAESIVKSDPAVKARVFQAQVRPFDLFWLTNKFEAGRKSCVAPSSSRLRNALP